MEKLNSFKIKIEKAFQFKELSNGTISRLVEKVEIEKDGTAIIYYRLANPVGFYFIIFLLSAIDTQGALSS